MVTFWGVLEATPFDSSSSTVVASGEVAVKTRRFRKLKPFDEDRETLLFAFVGEVVEEEETVEKGEECGLQESNEEERHELKLAEIGIGEDTEDTEPSSFSLELSKAEGQSLRGEGEMGGGVPGENSVDGGLLVPALTRPKTQGNACSLFSFENSLNKLISASRLKVLTCSTLNSPFLCNWASVLNNLS